MKEAIKRMKTTNSSNNPDSLVKPSSKEGLVDRTGFEPATSAVRGRRSFH